MARDSGLISKNGGLQIEEMGAVPNRRGPFCLSCGEEPGGGGEPKPTPTVTWRVQVWKGPRDAGADGVLGTGPGGKGRRPGEGAASYPPPPGRPLQCNPAFHLQPQPPQNTQTPAEKRHKSPMLTWTQIKTQPPTYTHKWCPPPHAHRGSGPQIPHPRVQFPEKSENQQVLSGWY